MSESRLAVSPQLTVDGWHSPSTARSDVKDAPFLEAELAQEPDLPTDASLDSLRQTIARAVKEGDSEQVKDLPKLVEEIVVESRACIQPYFIPPGVRTPIGSRRRTGIEPARELPPPHRF